MRSICILILAAISISSYAQVGIGNTDPNAQLDVRSSNQATPASNDGILIPKIDEFPSTLPAAAQDGMLVFASGSGSVAKGFYYWNNTSSVWVPLSSSSSSDDDWHEEGTSSPADDISDNIFTFGEVGVGTNTPDYLLDIFDSTHDRALNIGYFRGSPSTDIAGIYAETNDNNPGNTSRGIYNYVRGANGNKQGIWNRISPTGSGTHVGVRNNVTNSSGGALYGVYSTLNGSSSTADQTGIFNQITVSGTQNRGTYNAVSSGVNSWGVKSTVSGSGIVYGTENDLSISGSSEAYGTHNQLSGSGTGSFYGTYNTLGGSSSGDKIGSFNLISPTSGGTHYGLYSETEKTGSFAGFFNGSVAIGTISPFGSGIPDHYIMPASRGNDGEVMQTDSSGNLSWVNPTTISDDDWTRNINDLYPVNTADRVGIGTSAPSMKLDVVEDGDAGVASFLLTNASGITEALTNELTSSDTSNMTGFRNTLNVSGGSGNKTGIRNELFAGTGGVSGLKRALDNSIISDGGDAYGVSNSISGIGDGDHYGTYNVSSGDGSGSHYGTYNSLDGAGNGTKFGSYNVIAPSAGGTHYGVYSNVTKSGSYAALFTGDVRVNGYRLELTGSTEATGTAGTGVLEIANSLRIDGNEIVTDDSSILYLQNGNNGRLSVDDDTFTVIGPSNRVGIGTTSPAFQLQMSTGSAAKPSSSTWIVASDQRLKKNISAYKDGLNLIMQIDPVWFTYNGKAEMPSETGVGTLAQEFQEIAPYMVKEWRYESDDKTISDEYLAVDYGPLTFALVNAVKEQQEKINTLERELAEIKALLMER